MRWTNNLASFRAGSWVTPSNSFIKFSRNDIEQSVASWLQQMVDCDAVADCDQDEDRVLIYDTLNKMANRVAAEMDLQHTGLLSKGRSNYIVIKV